MEPVETQNSKLLAQPVLPPVETQTSEDTEPQLTAVTPVTKGRKKEKTV